MNWKGKKVLVTGGSGFIGSHLVRRLVNEGANVTVLVRYQEKLDNIRSAPIWNNISLMETDIRNSDIAKKLNEISPEIIFHFPSDSLPEKGLVETKIMDKIYPKQEEKIEFKARLFGIKGEKMEVKSWLNYSTKRKKETTMSKIAYFTNNISEVPIDLVLDIPKKIPVYPEKRTELSFGIRYYSFIDETIQNLSLLIELPQNFIFKESNQPRI